MIDEQTKSDLRYMASLFENINSVLLSENPDGDDLYHTTARLHQLLKTGTDVYNAVAAESHKVNKTTS